jgi:hypothetical protein
MDDHLVLVLLFGLVVPAAAQNTSDKIDGILNTGYLLLVLARFIEQ